MERMLVVVFDSEDKAYEASRALQRLDEDGVIAVSQRVARQVNESCELKGAQ
jgi:uncharacterized membrane protein